ncbi:unnamed protein product [Cylindrotheca closterium]|uniref:LITAF domain-containing protein n=1 Tax=Cylindrotheca closterium TaxID=2856 RepID=A0AAD2CPA4_9STRA|nr:unnamed protein product [Cylindrotheca closterium]
MTSYTTTKTNYLSTPTYAYDTPMIEVSDIMNSPSSVSSPQRSTTTPPANMDQMLAKKYYESDLDITISGSRRPIQLPLCPHCGAEHVRTHTRTHPNAATWAGVGVGAIVFFPLCWIPLVSDAMKKTDHYCQNCNNKIGSVKPFEGFCVKEQY